MSLTKVLKAVNALKINKTSNSKEMYLYLTEAYNEVKGDESLTTLFLRNLFFILSIQRDHYIYNDIGIKKGRQIGAQEFISSRIILTWLFANMNKWAIKNLNLFFEYSGWKLLFYNMIQTTKGSAKKPSKFISHETTMEEIDALVDLVYNQLRNPGSTLSLMAKWMPRYQTKSNTRRRVFKVGHGFKPCTFTPKYDIFLNGKLIKKGTKVTTKIGDTVSFDKSIRPQTVVKRDIDREFIKKLCKKMNWSVKDYTHFRSTHLKNTPEYLFSTEKILEFSKMSFIEWLNKCSSGQQYIVGRRLTKKKNDQIVPNERWGDIAKHYIEWDNEQNKVAEKVRLNNFKPTKSLKVKTTGVQTIDLLADLFSGRQTTDQINTKHTALLSRLEMDIPAFISIDGSGSMLSPMGSRSWAGMDIDAKYKHLRYIDVACTLALTFMMKNPNPKFRETFSWFSKDAYIVEITNFKNPNVDSFLYRDIKKVPKYKVIDLKKPFTENLQAMKGANPMTASSTNLGATIELMLSLGLHTEELPQILLFITDEEGNSGLSVPQAIKKANDAGWYPLVIFWGIKSTSRLEQYKNVDNVLITRGFSEATLNQILGSIRRGSVSLEDELYAVNEMIELSPVQYKSKKVKKLKAVSA